MASLAEREGFEPPIGLHLCRISSAVHSTTLPPLLKAPSRGSPVRSGRVLGEDGEPDKARSRKIQRLVDGIMRNKRRKPAPRPFFARIPAEWRGARAASVQERGAEHDDSCQHDRQHSQDDDRDSKHQIVSHAVILDRGERVHSADCAENSRSRRSAIELCRANTGPALGDFTSGIARRSKHAVPLPLIAMQAEKGGFAGRCEPTDSTIARAAPRNAIRALT
jgi:hypothetical protein